MEESGYSPETQEKLVTQILALHHHNQLSGINTIVCIAGGSSTGKSTQVASYLHNKLSPLSQTISQDNYQLGRDYYDKAHPVYLWDALENFGIPESFELLSLLKSGKSGLLPEYSFTEGKRTGSQPLQPTPVILFEGLYAGYGELREMADLLIYTEMPMFARMLRRIFRNTFERFRAEPSLILKSYLKGGVLKAHRDLVVKQKNVADFILRIPYFFTETIKRFDLKKIDKPFPTDEVLFSFAISENSFFQVEKYKIEKLHFSIYYQSDLYFTFEIDTETHELLVRTDLLEM